MPDINAAMTKETGRGINSMGTSVTYTPKNGSPKAITVLFDNEYTPMDLSAGTISTTGPAVHCKPEDLSSTPKGDAFTIDGTSYTVQDIQPDNSGMTTCILKKA